MLWIMVSPASDISILKIDFMGFKVCMNEVIYPPHDDVSKLK